MCSVCVYTTNMLVGFWIICALVPASLGGDHTIVGPKEFRVGAANKVILNFHGYEGTATVTAALRTWPRRLFTFEVIRQPNVDVTRPVDLNFMIHKSDLMERTAFRNAYVELNVQVTDSSEDFTETMLVLLNFTSGYIFITTDRPAYSPGDTVEVAVALTDQQLMPVQGVTVHIFVKIPEYGNGTEGIVVNKCIRSEHAQDFITYGYRIPNTLMVGKWSVEATVPDMGIGTKTTFLVDRRNAFPNFNVRVQMEQSYILPTQYALRGIIHAEYSYGKKVTGSYYIIVTLERTGEIPHSVIIFREPSRFTRRIWNGKGAFSIPIDAVNRTLEAGETWMDLVAEGASLSVEAAVTDRAESIYESGIASGIRFTISPYEIATDRSSRYFSPGIVYEVKANVLDVVTKEPLSDIPVEVAAGGVVKQVTSNQRGEITASFDRTTGDELHVELITAKPGLGANGQSTANFTARRHQATAVMTITMDSLVTVGETASAKLRFEPRDVTDDVKYFVVSKGQVVLSGVIPVPTGHRGGIIWDIDITPHMVPSSRLLAYYMRGNELVSNSVWFDVTSVGNGNELQIQVSSTEVKPGQYFDVLLTGNPGARFHLSAVDRAAYFVYNRSRLTRDVMWNKMQEYDNACSRQGGSNNKNVFEEAGMFVVNKDIRPVTYMHPTCPTQPVLRRKRRAEQTVDLNSDIGLMGSFGIPMRDGGTILYAKRSWESSHLRATYFLSERSQEDNFQDKRLPNTGTLNADGLWTGRIRAFDKPSRIDFTAYSFNEQGFSVAKPRQVVVFQSVFIQLYLPHSLRRLKQASIRYAIFNYNDNSTQVSVEMSHGPELCSRFQANEMNQIDVLNVPGNSAKSSHFTVMPIKIPDFAKGVRIEMTATSPEANYTLVKYVHVEPESLSLNESSGSYVLAPPANATIDFQVPRDGFRSDMPRCWIYAYANLQGSKAVPDPIINRYHNLQSLVHRPIGNGESGMIRTGPIVYIHKYRLATHIVEAGGPEEAQTIQYIKQGYDIAMKWRSDEVQKRAWAVWSNHPPSVWLNAFVDRVFLEASEIDRDMTVQPICNSLGWLLSVQQLDGRFVETQSIFYREIDGLMEGEIALTAYVAATLSIAIQPELENQACPALADQIREKRDRSLAYINNLFTELSNNSYVAAMTAYGLAVSGSPMAGRLIERLRDLCTEIEQHIYCQTASDHAGRVETTSYALLAEISALPEQATEIELRRIRKMALWLIEQRNSFGGSQTTQDTVMALHASAEYMKWIYRINGAPSRTDMNVTLTTDHGTTWQNEQQVFHLDDENQVLQQEIEVPSYVIYRGTILARVTGKGEASLSYRCVWREKIDGERCPFQIDVAKQIKQSYPGFNQFALKITIRKLEYPDAGMTVVDVMLPTDFVPLLYTIRILTSDFRFENSREIYKRTDNSVKFYLKRVAHARDTVISFELSKSYVVITNSQPAEIKVYDYSSPEVSCSKFYTADERPGELQVACHGTRASEQSLCKCAEGACPVCRTRKEIATETKCIYRRSTNECGGNDQTCLNFTGCFDTRAIACQRHFLKFVQVITVVKNQPRGFVEFNVKVIHNLYPGLDYRAVGHPRAFRMRNDCFEKCRDDELTRGTDLIAVGRSLVIYGNEPIMGSGTRSYLYYLDGTSYIEVTPDRSKCTRMRWRYGCYRREDFATKACMRKRVCKHHRKLRYLPFRGGCS